VSAINGIRYGHRFPATNCFAIAAGSSIPSAPYSFVALATNIPALMEFEIEIIKEAVIKERWNYWESRCFSCGVAVTCPGSVLRLLSEMEHFDQR